MDSSRNFSITCDWFQMHIKENEPFAEKETPFFQVTRTGQSKTFRNIYDITDTVTKRTIASYATDASEAVLQRGHGILKLENAELYIHEDLKGYVQTLLKRLNMEFVGITRIDIAYDFQEFRNNLNPGVFIEKYIQNKFIRVTKSSAFSCYGKQYGMMKQFQTLQFGATGAAVGIKLYNKTKELERNEKPYIRALHAANFEDNKKDIWRLEFSLKSKTKMFQNHEKEFKLHSLDCLEIDNIYGMFQGLFNSRFVFKKKSQRTRLTNFKNLELLVFDFPALELKYIEQPPTLKKSNRGVKILLKQLDTFKKTFLSSDEIIKQQITGTISKVIDLSVKEDLLSFFETTVTQSNAGQITPIEIKELISKLNCVFGLEYFAEKRKIEFEKMNNYTRDLNELQILKANDEALNNHFNRANKDARQWENNATEWDKYLEYRY